MKEVRDNGKRKIKGKEKRKMRRKLTWMLSVAMAIETIGVAGGFATVNAEDILQTEVESDYVEEENLEADVEEDGQEEEIMTMDEVYPEEETAQEIETVYLDAPEQQEDVNAGELPTLQADSKYGTYLAEYDFGYGVTCTFYDTDGDDEVNRIVVSGSGAIRDYHIDDWTINTYGPSFWNYHGLDKEPSCQLIIEPGVTAIGESAFNSARFLADTLYIPSTVTRIERRAFEGCLHFRNLVIEDGVTYIGERAFYCLDGVYGAVTIPASVKYIGENAFRDSEISSFTVYNSNAEIGEGAFNTSGGNYHSVTIRGYSNSTAERYARENGLEFIALDKSEVDNGGDDAEDPHVHTWTDWSIVRSSTVFTPGERKRTCMSCGYEMTEVIPKLNPVLELSATTLDLKVKKSTTAVKVVRMAAGDSVASWKSNNTSIVTVNKNGKITAKGKTGYATVTVTLKSGKKAKVHVYVKKKIVVKTKKISGIKKTVFVKRKATLKLKPVLTPSNSTEKITYSSSNKKVASVTSKGVIKAKKRGRTTITIKSGSKKAKCTVIVK